MSEQAKSITIGDTTFHLVYADLLPPLSQAKYNALRTSIRAVGIRDDIHVRQRADGSYDVIDGQHRLTIAAELDLPRDAVPLKEHDVDDDTAETLAYSLNLARRHLSAEDRQQVVASLRKKGKSLRQIAEIVGVSRTTVQRDIEALEATGVTFVTPEQVTGADGKQYDAQKPQTRTAALAGKIWSMYRDGKTTLYVDDIRAQLGDTENAILHAALSLLMAQFRIRQHGGERGRYDRIAPVSGEQVQQAILDVLRRHGALQLGELEHKAVQIVRAPLADVRADLDVLQAAGRVIETPQGWTLVPPQREAANRPDPDRTVATFDGQPVTAADIPGYDQLAEDARGRELDDLIDTDAIKLNVGPWDIAARRWAITIARKLYAAGIWDGQDILTFNVSVDELRDRLYGSAQEPVTSLVKGRDYTIQRAGHQQPPATQPDASPRRDAPLDTAREFIADALRQKNHLMGRGEIARRAGLTREASDRALDVMVEAGNVIEVKRGGARLYQYPAIVEQETWQPTDVDLRRIRAAIRHYLFERPQETGVQTIAIAERTGLQPWQVRKACTQLARDGVLEIRGDYWMPAERKAEAAASPMHALKSALSALRTGIANADQSIVKLQIDALTPEQARETIEEIEVALLDAEYLINRLNDTRENLDALIAQEETTEDPANV